MMRFWGNPSLPLLPPPSSLLPSSARCDLFWGRCGFRAFGSILGVGITRVVAFRVSGAVGSAIVPRRRGFGYAILGVRRMLLHANRRFYLGSIPLGVRGRASSYVWC